MTTRHPEWDIDAAFGTQGENTVRELLNMAADRIEVKRKRLIDLALYVEMECQFGGEYKPSGIAVTRA